MIVTMAVMTASFSFLLFGCRQQPQKEVKPLPTVEPLRSPGYTYACWLNGWRKNKTDKSPEILAIQASCYDFTLDMSNFSKAGFSSNLAGPLSYASMLTASTDPLYQLPAPELVIMIELNGEQYRAVSCAAGRDPDSRRLGFAKMWESGRFVQHFELEDLLFQSASGKALNCKADLDLVAWPDSLTLTASLAPAAAEGAGWSQAKVTLQLKGSGVDCRNEKTVAGVWLPSTTNAVTVTYARPGRVVSAQKFSIHVTSGTNNVFPVAYEETKSCFVAKAPKIKRVFKTGYTDIREYDDFLITVDSAESQRKEIPFLLDFRSPANITGLCPMLCDKGGRPTGIPVQLSKNWHYGPMGAYLMAYTSLPVKPGRTEYLLRVAYGFYGTLPSASHSQLSLIGYAGKGGNGRWDQLAIGCWGETICFDMDMSLVNLVVTDVRMLMARNGLNGQKWSWTDAGWGGDWFEMLDADGNKLAFKDLKTAYLSQGPCLTDVRYAGFYGSRREVGLKAEVHTLRTDDYARTFQRFRYTFNTPVANTNISFYRQGKTGQYATPKVAYGNRDGLLAEQDVPLGLKTGHCFIDRLPLEGKGPWWVAFPGAKHTNGRDWGTGYRAFVIRSYTAIINGKIYTQPTVSFPVSVPVHGPKNEISNVDLLLVPPREVTAFKPGDVIEMDVEWITLHRTADDYYGPNEAYRKHLVEQPCSWKTTYREAIGNDLRMTVRGGKVLKRYPIFIQAEKPAVEVTITGGVGFVPIRFEGLASIKEAVLTEVVNGKEIRLDQSVHGNDFWQADYDEGTRTYSLTYNLPLDNKPTSTWRLTTQ
jgi:hypothetical protein